MTAFPSTLQVNRNEEGELIVNIDVQKSRNTYDVRGELSSVGNRQLHEFVQGRRDQATGGILWPTGGSIPVLNTQDGYYIALTLRDGGAPSYPYHLELSSGIGDSMDEIRNPNLLCATECFEEVIIYVENEDGHKEWAIPHFDNEVLDSAIAKTANDHRSKWADSAKMSLPSNPTDNGIRISSELVSFGDANITVSTDDGDVSYTDCFVLDPSESTAEIIKAMVMDFNDYSLSNIRVLDGQMEDGRVLDRQVFLVALDEFFNLTSNPSDSATAHRMCQSGLYWNGSDWKQGYESGVPVKFQTPKTTPNLATSGKVLSKKFFKKL